MKKKPFIPLIFAFCCFVLPLSSQNTPHILSTGIVKKEIAANKAILKFRISEVQPNQRSQTPYQPFSETYKMVIDEFKKLGVKEQTIEEEKLIEVTKYQQVETAVYKVQVNDLETVSKFTKLKIPGFNFQEVSYVFDELSQELEDEMAFSAIDDALRKAQIMAKKTNRNIGNVINIKDFSHGCCRSTLYNTQPTKYITYQVKVSYELLD